jgi:hypothetical protein
MNMIRRLERLERAVGVSGGPPDPPMEILVKYVAPDGSVVGSHVVKIDPPLQGFGQRGSQQVYWTSKIERD